MPIYTRTGDKGTTALFGGKRVSKSDLQVEAYGSVDELSSFLGLLISKLRTTNHELITIQKDLYAIMANLSGAKVDLHYLERRVTEFEKEIDKIDKKLPKLTRFILPGGTEISSLFHICRTFCRRSERNVVKSFSNYKLQTINYKLVIKYLNRLSDFFFTLARLHAKDKEVLT
ncbi:ATP:cob(I)alamin adenosyltransferase [Candidatus Roizmanbacteria bacterium RIFCSPHIGHO2_02_FULL_39_9]|uniref:Corrinoid adenosyltransferase n=1 Tax=Candidatus Roizmanbacteria bacterium RIFCSPHIGHO2_02_FULL_39_9 TaxID=1802040 RepID=A0A1F7H410_9BACT|nr:MAG: ATP:cob(I)alamin adenosyltransferase [Candidatus Roizmanbacteria bacterium RIFCSPHIGHO2_02_FULL_39_9]